MQDRDAFCLVAIPCFDGIPRVQPLFGGHIYLGQGQRIWKTLPAHSIEAGTVTWNLGDLMHKLSIIYKCQSNIKGARMKIRSTVLSCLKIVSHHLSFAVSKELDLWNKSFENPRIHFPSQPPVASAIHQNHTIGAWHLNGPHDLRLFICQMANDMGMINTCHCHCCHCSCFFTFLNPYMSVFLWPLVFMFEPVFGELPNLPPDSLCMPMPTCCHASNMKIQANEAKIPSIPGIQTVGWSFQKVKTHSNNQSYAKFNS